MLAAAYSRWHVVRNADPEIRKPNCTNHRGGFLQRIPILRSDQSRPGKHVCVKIIIFQVRITNNNFLQPKKFLDPIFYNKYVLNSLYKF